MNSIIPTITLVTASVDGHILAAYRTRVLPHDSTLLAEGLEASDMDAFTPPIDTQPGLTVEIYPQTSRETNIPDILWAHLWEGICERLQTRAITRRAVCERIQVNLGSAPISTAGAPVVATFAPKDLTPFISGINNISPSEIGSTTITTAHDDPEVVDHLPDFKDYLKPGQTFPF